MPLPESVPAMIKTAYAPLTTPLFIDRFVLIKIILYKYNLSAIIASAAKRTE